MKFLHLFFVASMAVLKVILVSSVGSFMALDRVNIFGDQARNHFNNVVFYVFSPALIIANLAKTITFESMVKLWFLPVNILITFIVGSVLGWILIKITRAPSHLRGLILGCCAAGNLGNLLLIIIPQVCEGNRRLFGAPDACHTYAMAYASLSLAVGCLYIWTYVYNIVRVYSSRRTNEVEISVLNNSSTEETSKQYPENCSIVPLLLKDRSISEDNADKFELPCIRSNEEVKVTILVKFKQQLRKLAGKMNMKMVFAPSTIATIVGFIVGTVPPIRKSMIGESAPLRVIQDSISLLGDGAIPVMTLIMGGNLTKGLKGSGVGISAIIGIIIIRYILLPLCGIFFVKGAIRFDLIHSDPLYHFVLLLHYALPPAMNIGTITQLFGAGQNECSVIMLWTYALASASLTLWCILFMLLVS